ncbi:MAG: right-handed parallel beta-helix repeat-containing protein [Planctomycetes bacterium]|nr:right-handed parallel beta-helix repeat-containing protein [Planctomycetota bacterium]
MRAGAAPLLLLPLLLPAASLPAAPAGREVRVRDTAELRAALRDLRPGTTVLLAPGTYEGGHRLEGVAGTEKEPVVIRGADPAKPPLLEGGGSTALHLSDCSFLRLAHLRVRGFAANGINIDDGGTFATPARGITVESVGIEDTGPRGNHDGLKMSGVAGFLVKDCRISGWGGSAIDMVGCRDGVVESCRFEGREGFSASNGVQMKGGTRDVLVHRSYFRDCGSRAVNLGGSTGLEYFRPEVGDFEARDIEVAGNRFHGSAAAVAFVTAASARVHHNTIHLPGKWVLRILQETDLERFRPCREGVFEDNLVVFDGAVGTFVNTGPRTAPETFRFRRNAWWDAAGTGRRPDLPVAEEDGVAGVDPALADPGGPAMRATSRDPRLKGKGADAYDPPPRGR